MCPRIAELRRNVDRLRHVHVEVRPAPDTPRKVVEKHPVFRVPVHEPLTDARAVELHVEIEHYTVLDKVRVSFDGAALGKPAVRSAARELDDDPADVGESSWLVWPLSAEDAGPGTHQVRTVLLERNRHVKPALVVKHVEIHVRY